MEEKERECRRKYLHRRREKGWDEMKDAEKKASDTKILKNKEANAAHKKAVESAEISFKKAVESANKSLKKKIDSADAAFDKANKKASDKFLKKWEEAKREYLKCVPDLQKTQAKKLTELYDRHTDPSSRHFYRPYD